MSVEDVCDPQSNRLSDLINLVLIKEKRARKQSCSEHGTENLSGYTAIVMKNESNYNQKRGDDEAQQNNEKHVMNSFIKKQNGWLPLYIYILFLMVSIDITAHFSALKLDTKQCSEPFISPIPNVHESVISNFRSSLVGEQIEAIAINNTINEACESLFDLAVFGDFVLYLYQSTVPLLGNFRPLSMYSTSLPPNFLSIFDQAPDIQYRHKFDYQSLNALLKERLTEIGFLALATNPKRISITKISRFLDKIKIAAHEIFDELLKVPNLTKEELKNGKSLASNVISTLSSRYIESIMKVTDSLRGIIIRSETIADQFVCYTIPRLFYLPITSFQMQCSFVLDPQCMIDPPWLQLNWLMPKVLELNYGRAYVNVKIQAWFQHQSTYNLVSRKDTGNNLHKTNYNIINPKNYFQCFDLFHTQLGLELHMVKYHKKYLINSFT
uniref:Uncharacterized protein n=1 Tax=Heterorhabditis bacteriophora TaxID=37862 RepID=A0A1I7WU22_HETBA